VGLSGQINPYGAPAIKNYPPVITNGSEQNWTIVQDKRGVIYAGNNDEGVLEYDGNEWRKIPISNNSIVRSLDCTVDGTVYVGAVSELGYLAPDISGSLKYNSLMHLLDSGDRNFSDVWKTFSLEDRVIFHTRQIILTYYPDEQRFETYKNSRHALFGFYENNKYFTGDYLEGLMVLEDDTVVQAKGGEYFKKKDIYGLTAYDDTHLLIGATDFGISLYNMETGNIDTEFATEETNQYLNDNFLTHLTRLKNGDFMASTGGGGLVIVSREGELLEIISNEEGMQNQIIYYSYESEVDYPNPHVWTAMDLGISKVSINSPLRLFSEEYGYKGQGLIHTIGSIDGNLFIGTTTGIYAKSTVDSKAMFQKVDEFSRNIWDIEKVDLGNGVTKLLAIGVPGFMEILPNSRILYLDNEIKGVKSIEDRVFWGYTIAADPYKQGRIYLGRKSSLTALTYKNGSWHQDFANNSLSDEIRSIAVTENKLWFGSNLMGVGCISPITDSAKVVYFDENHGLPSKDNNSIFQHEKNILIGTIDGIYRVDETGNEIRFVKDSLINSYLPRGLNKILQLYKDPSGDVWMSYENEDLGWSITMLTPIGNNEYTAKSRPFYGMDNFSTDAFYSMTGDDVWFPKVNYLFHFDKSGDFNQGSFKALIRKVTVNSLTKDTVIYNGSYPLQTENGIFKTRDNQDPDHIPSIKHVNNNIQFRWSAPYFDQEDKVEYSYFLEGFSSSWSSWEKVLYQDFTNLPHGNYTFSIKARNVYMDESTIDSFSFIILRPWYLTFVAFIAYLIIATIIVLVIIKLYTRRLKNENIRLEGIIQERTAEIRIQKEELTDSIEYASRIQRALLPPLEMLQENNLNHFVLFKPRDIVSGDFYWFGKSKEKIFIVAADCTGHGVPGAFMSMLGISFLEEIVVKSEIHDTNKILDGLRDHVITSLRQTGQSIDESTKDGMDLAMISINSNTGAVQFSGAYNPLYIVRELTDEEKKTIQNGNKLNVEKRTVHNDTHLLYQIKADHMPIGISEKEQDFTVTEFVPGKNNCLYLFSDGYVDQFGGPMGKKFMSRNFKKLLLSIQDLDMEEQKNKLDSTLTEWMGSINQIDDILVIGVKMS